MDLNIPRELLRYVYAESQKHSVSAQTIIIRMISAHKDMYELKDTDDINDSEDSENDKTNTTEQHIRQ